MNSIGELNNLLKNNKDQLTGFYKKGWNPLGLYGNTGTALKTFEAQCIYSIVKYLKCSKIVEIGTGIGFSTIYLSQAIHELNGDKLHSIDIREESTSYTKQLLQRLGNNHLIDKIKFHTGNSKDVLPTIENNLDFALIDGSHTYDDTRRELLQVYPKVRKGGVIAFHDIQDSFTKGPAAVWKELLNKDILKGEDFTLVQLDRSMHEMFNYKSDNIEIQRLSTKWKQKNMCPKNTDPCTAMGVLFK